MLGKGIRQDLQETRGETRAWSLSPGFLFLLSCFFLVQACAPEPPRLFVFHKPSGLITAERDPAGRPTIYTALRNALPAGAP